MAIDLRSGKLLIIGADKLSVIDPGYGVQIYMAPGSKWLLPTATVRIPELDQLHYDAGGLQVLTSSATQTPTFSNLSVEPETTNFRSYGLSYAAGSMHLFTPNDVNLIRIELGPAEGTGGDVIITVIDIDPGHRIIDMQVE